MTETQKFDRENPDIVWVSPDYMEEEYGTWDQPYSSVDSALEHLEPGKTLVLKQGIYDGDVTIQVSGTARKPIRIVADDNADVQITGGCWFLYDTSDLIISNLTFKGSPHGALSVIGKCNRNRFEQLRFIGCGTAGKASCTMYFGGSGGSNNIVEHCTFESDDSLLQKSASESIALMISEGDLDGGEPVRNHIVRKNSFSKYGYGVLVGSSNTSDNQYGHVIEYNRIDGCTRDGIYVKCGDTQVRGNCVENCPGNSISLLAGCSSVVESNRIVDCKNGIRVNGAGHTLSNNCIVRTDAAAVTVCSANGELEAASNLFIESNTFVDCGTAREAASSGCSGIRVEPGSSCIIRNNLVYGTGTPLQMVKPADSSSETDGSVDKAQLAQVIVNENAVSTENRCQNGFEVISVAFPDGSGSYENTTGFGAQGWVLTPQTFDPKVDETDEDCDYIDGSIIEDDDGELVIPGEEESRELFDNLYSQGSDLAFNERDDV
jgi:hypothetical protein